jgi:hypothetical protein
VKNNWTCLAKKDLLRLAATCLRLRQVLAPVLESNFNFRYVHSFHCFSFLAFFPVLYFSF